MALTRIKTDQILDGTITGSDIDTSTSASFDALTLSGDLDVDSGTLFVDSANGRVGIGTTNPQVPMQLAYTSGVPDSSLLSSDAFVITAEENAPGFVFAVASDNSAADRGVFKAIRSRGTLASPTAANDNDEVLSLLGTVYDGVEDISSAGITMAVDGNVSAGVAPQRIEFLTSSGPSRQERMRIDSSGNVGIGTSSPDKAFVVQGSDTEIVLNSSTNNPTLRFRESGITSGSIATNGNNMIFDVGTSEAMRIDSSGNVGIGTSSPQGKLSVLGAGRIVTIGDSGTVNVPEIRSRNFSNTGDAFLRYSAFEHFFNANGSEAMRIDANGNVGIGTSSPSVRMQAQIEPSNRSWNTFSTHVAVLENNTDTLLEMVSGNSSLSALRFGDSDSSGKGTLSYNHANDSMQFIANGAERMRIDSSGNVGIGTSSPNAKLDVNGQINADRIDINDDDLVLTNYSGGDIANLVSGSTFGSLIEGDEFGNIAIGIRENGSSDSFAIVSGGGDYDVDNTYNKLCVRVEADGDTTINGSLSKNSGSFKIDHPLPEKSETHHLVHSFVESPRADNVYRGTATLSNGTAQVNLDAYIGMTEGTFSALNGNIDVFLQNKTGWEPLKGEVIDNILHVYCRDETATDTISWMVVGERQDQHMLDTKWTDEFGRPVLEPEKEIEQEIPDDE